MAAHNAHQINLFTTKAHVFQINPETKNSWMPRGESAIPISFVVSSDANADEPKKRELKLVGTGDNGESTLNTVILAKTTFTKRSSKFGQWIDPTGTLYGLGFGTDAELTEFVDTFQRLQYDILSQPAHQHHPAATSNPQSGAATQNEGHGWSQRQPQQNQTNASETNGRYSAKLGNNNLQQYSYSSAHPLNQQQQQQHVKREPPTLGQRNGDINCESDTNNNTSSNNKESNDYPRSQSLFGLQSRASAGKASPEGDETSASQSEWQVREQLKYENERLKQALEESSKNSGIWHNELLNLRTNNVKLTQALQESKAHVEEWERELMNLRDENKELKSRLVNREPNEDPDSVNEYKNDIQKYKNYVDDAKLELKRKDMEIEELQRSMGELELRSQSTGQNGRESSISGQQKQKLDIINVRLEAKLSELIAVQRDFAQVMDDIDQ